MFETVYEVKFLQGVNCRPYNYRSYTHGIKTGDLVIIDVNGGGKEFSGYKLARVVNLRSLPSEEAKRFTVKLVAAVDDSHHLEQKKLSNLLDQAARNVEVHEAQVKVAEDAVVNLNARRAALIDARAHQASVQALASQAELARLRRMDGGDQNTPRYWADRADQVAGRELAYQRGPFKRRPGALDDQPHDYRDLEPNWGDCV